MKGIVAMSNVPLYEEKDFKNIKKFHLMLGPACNMACRHCSQTPVKRTCLSLTVSPKVYRLIDNYIEYGLTHHTPGGSTKLVFWGGEPLMYWDVIAPLVQRIHEKYHLKREDKLQLCITTNGRLLTDEIVDFINEYGMSFCFSYDSPYPFAIRDYVSDEICERVKKVNKYAVLSGFNAYDCDPILSYRCLKTKFPNVYEIDVAGTLCRSFDLPEDIYRFDWDAVKNSFRKLRIAAQLDDVFALEYLKRYFGVKRWRNSSCLGCAIGERFLTSSLDGRVAMCHDGGEFFGTIDESLETLHQKSVDRLLSIVSPLCKECKYTDMCSGRCMLDARDEEGNFYSCRDLHWHIYDIIRDEYQKMVQPLTDEDLNWYHEQEKIMEKQVQMFLQEGQRYEKEHTRLPKEMMYRIKGGK